MMLGAVVAVWGALPPGPPGGDAQGPTLRLATPWPAQERCASYSGVDLSVDDRVGSAEWRGANGATLVFDLSDSSNAHGGDDYRLGSDGTDCHEGQTTCIVYRKPVGRSLHVRAVRALRGLPAGFKPGAFAELVLHGDIRRRAPVSRSERPRDFGARLFLHCIDTAKPKAAESCCPQPVPLSQRAPAYKRQYVGVLDRGRRLIHASFFCEAPQGDWHHTAVDVDDGADCYLQVDYDVRRRRFASIAVNGGA
jgi:hypothetical protein